MLFRKDKRIKGCTNPKCKRCKTHYKYKSEDKYCSLCKHSLRFVCSKCFGELENKGRKHTICDSCLAIKEEKKARKKEAAADVVRAAGAVGNAVTDKISGSGS